MPRDIAISSEISLTGEGAAWLPRHATVIIADVHLGYATAAKRRGGYLPGVESAAASADRALAVARRVGATRLVVAGDLRHSTRDVDAAELEEVRLFRAGLSTLAHVELVAGNHDRGMAGMTTSTRVGDVEVCHAPPADVPANWVICGHLHPTVTVRDETGAGARYPCALVGPRIVVLPAFSAWAGGVPVRRLLPSLPAGEWQSYPIAGGEIFAL